MNILIIGQGIAGSCLAWELKRRGAFIFHIFHNRTNHSKESDGLILE